jgi:hypothetical protein
MFYLTILWRNWVLVIGTWRAKRAMSTDCHKRLVVDIILFDHPLDKLGTHGWGISGSHILWLTLST